MFSYLETLSGLMDLLRDSCGDTGKQYLERFPRIIHFINPGLLKKRLCLLASSMEHEGMMKSPLLKQARLV
jgi:hypothetical protein